MLPLAAFVVMGEAAWAESDDPRAALAHGIQLYLGGDATQARDALQALLAEGPTLPPEVRREALVWLGDVLYAEGGPSAARNAFEALLDEAPDYPMDPFSHSPEVVRYFEELRAALPPRVPVAPPPVAPLPRQPWPWKVLLPGGAYYFTEHEPVPGAIVGGLQLAALGVSLGTWVEIRDRFPDSGAFPEDAPGRREDFKTLVWTNRAVGIAGYLAYAVPVVVETSAWLGRGHLTMVVGPTTLTFSGRF